MILVPGSKCDRCIKFVDSLNNKLGELINKESKLKAFVTIPYDYSKTIDFTIVFRSFYVKEHKIIERLFESIIKKSSGINFETKEVWGFDKQRQSMEVTSLRMSAFIDGNINSLEHIGNLFVKYFKRMLIPPLKNIKHICFEGPISAGKSTVAEDISMMLNANFRREPVEDNEYLPDFYKDLASGESAKTRSAAMMQLHLLGRRYENHLSSVWGQRDVLNIEDRSIFGDTVFAYTNHLAGNINALDYKTYLQNFETMKDYLRYPDLMVYLNVYPKVSYERITQMRKRGCESKIQLSYLEELKDYYDQFVDQINQYCPVLNIDWNENVLPESDRMEEKLYDLIFKIKEWDEKRYWPFFHFRKAKGAIAFPDKLQK